jgi:hypothetical protein
MWHVANPVITDAYSLTVEKPEEKKILQRQTPLGG